MIVRVVMSKATRVLDVSFDLSTLFLHPTTYRGPLLALTITARHGTQQQRVTRQYSRELGFLMPPHRAA
jgi:hypothetical protein